MAKRKREIGSKIDSHQTDQQQHAKRSKGREATAAANNAVDSVDTAIQIVAGSYDRVLHGITATIQHVRVKDKGKGVIEPQIEFADTFLFDAHTSAIKCLAVSPPSTPVLGQTQKVMLATGGTDERINIYNLSAHPPPKQDTDQKLISSLAPRPVLENRKNRELGTLLHHSSTVTRLAFPTRSKLLSSSEDSTIAVTRTRDWSLLSAIKAPIPKAQGRPSGDTAPLGGVPSGINDFAVHPSMKLMLSVSKGERCMRLWNLVTGKKAGVLNFSKEALQEVGEGRFSMGEGRQVVWGSCGGSDEFAVGFDREILVFGMDGTPKCRVMGGIRTKVHHIEYLDSGVDTEGGGDDGATYLAVATEDGRICFFSTRERDLQEPSGQQQQQQLGPRGAASERKATEKKPANTGLRVAKLVGQLGGKKSGVTSRIKDFVILPPTQATSVAGAASLRDRIIVSGSSDGKVAVWSLSPTDLELKESEDGSCRTVGKSLGSYETQNRITCLTAFIMMPRPEGVDESSADEGEGHETDESGIDEEGE